MAKFSPFFAASEAVFSFTLSARMPATAVSMSFVCCTSKGFKVACRHTKQGEDAWLFIIVMYNRDLHSNIPGTLVRVALDACFGCMPTLNRALTRVL